MIKVFEITEERVYKTLVEIDVPDDIQWQTSDYDIAVDEAVTLQAKWYEVGTHRKWQQLTTVVNWTGADRCDKTPPKR